MYKLISIFTGCLITLMITFNSTLASSTGQYSSSVIIHLTGLIAIGLLLFFTKSKLTFSRKVPLSLYCAGFIGVFTVLFNNLSFGAIGASLTLSLGLLGQSLISVIIDHYGFWGMPKSTFEVKKLLGFGVISLGILCMALS